MASQEFANLVNAAKNFGVAFDELIDALRSTFQRVIDFVKEILNSQKERDVQQQKFSLDLKRPFIAHQVNDRKPKHMIRKIIH